LSILTDAEIRKAMSRGELDIEPFSEEHLTPNGYDLAIAEVELPDTGHRFVSGEAVVPPFTRFMVSTVERIRLGPSLVAQLWLRTTWARRGVLASFGRIDAGFNGTLTFGALNASAAPLSIPIGETFAQLVAEALTGRAEVLYAQRSGHYQGQHGVTMAVNTDGGGKGDDPSELEAPCLSRDCHECCVETEMPLAPGDIVRLEALGHQRGAFTVEEDGLVFLANVEGRCYFLGPDGRCTEYRARPDGCRLYPLTLDEDLSEFVLDGLCPHRMVVEPSEEHQDALLGLLSRIGVARRKP
jgi:dCTP deaminase